jgi:prolipoprotein diacylglyceryltransferase
MTCYPKISDLINGWFGTNINLPIQSFGFFVALAFGVGAWMLVRALRRKERAGLLKPRPEKVVVGAPATPWEIGINALLGGVLAFKLVPAIAQWNTFSNNPQEFLFNGPGSWPAAIIGALLLGGLRWWEKNRQRLAEPEVKTVSVWPHERIGDVVTVAAISGILGARLMVLIENGGWAEFFANPGANFFSGLSIYGGLLLGIPTVILFARSKGIPRRRRLGGGQHRAQAGLALLGTGLALGLQLPQQRQRVVQPYRPRPGCPALHLCGNPLSGGAGLPDADLRDFDGWGDCGHPLVDGAARQGTGGALRDVLCGQRD